MCCCSVVTLLNVVSLHPARGSHPDFVPESKEVAPASNSSTKGKKHPYYRTLPCVLGSTDLECPRGASCTYIHVRQKELEGINSGTKAKKRSVAGGNSKFAYSASLECKYSTTDAGCPFGKNCTFRHSSEHRVKTSVRPKEETLEEKARRLARQTELEGEYALNVCHYCTLLISRLSSHRRLLENRATQREDKQWQYEFYLGDSRCTWESQAQRAVCSEAGQRQPHQAAS